MDAGVVSGLAARIAAVVAQHPRLTSISQTDLQNSHSLRFGPPALMGVAAYRERPEWHERVGRFKKSRSRAKSPKMGAKSRSTGGFRNFLIQTFWFFSVFNCLFIGANAEGTQLGDSGIEGETQ